MIQTADRRLPQRLERTGLLPAGIFFALAWLFTPISQPVEFDPDEGVNLIKAMLHAHGFTLYQQTWSDQPPLVTLLLAQLYEWAGPSLVMARTLTLAFGTLLVWAFYQTLRLRVSIAATVVGVTLLVISRMYFRLSVSVMIGLPALALAMLAIYLLLRSRSIDRDAPAGVMLAASGAVLALSMQAKLFTFIVVLPMLVLLMLPGSHSRLCRTGVWCAAWVGTFVFSSLMLGSMAGEQLVGTHAAAQSRDLDDQLHDLLRLAGMVGRHAIYLPLAAAALWWAWRRGVADVLLPLIWFTLAVVLLSVHRPLWYHHVLLLTIPLAWLAGYGVQAWLHWQGPTRWRIATAALLTTGLALPLATPLPRQLYDETYGYRFALHLDLPAELAATPSTAGNPHPAWVFADRPTYAYLADRLVPPPLAVQTSKRWQAGQISPHDMIAALHTHRPRHVILERYGDDHYGPGVMAYLERDYTLHHAAEQPLDHFPPLRHYVRND